MCQELANCFTRFMLLSAHNDLANECLSFPRFTEEETEALGSN